MAYWLAQNQTARPLLFLMVQSADHLSPATGLTPTVTLSKNGGAFGSPAGAVTELGNGWYAVAGNATDSNTLGPLLLHATATGADPVDDRYEVTAVDPHTALATQASVNTIDDFLDTEITAILAAVDTEIAAIKAKTDNLPASPAAVGSAMTLAADAITASALAADAILEIADGLLDRDMAAGADNGTAVIRTVRQALRLLRNKHQTLAGVLTVMKEDDATTSWTAALTTSVSADRITVVDPAGP